MMDESREIVASREDRHLERVDREIASQRVRYLPADDAATEDVDDERDVDPPQWVFT